LGRSAKKKKTANAAFGGQGLVLIANMGKGRVSDLRRDLKRDLKFRRQMEH